MFDKSQKSYISLREIITERTNRIVPWLGAGISKQAGLPGWVELRNLICDEFSKNYLKIEHTGTIHKRSRNFGIDSVW